MNETTIKDINMRVSVHLEKEKYYEMKRRLVGKTNFSEWIRGQIDLYLNEQE